MLSIILDTVQNLPIQEGSQLINYIAGGIAVAGTSSAVTIAVIKTQLKQHRKDIDYLMLSVDNHEKDHKELDKKANKTEAYMEMIKESLNEIKSKIG